MTPEQRLRRAIEAAVARLRESVAPNCDAQQCDGVPRAYIESIAADLEHAAREEG